MRLIDSKATDDLGKFHESHPFWRRINIDGSIRLRMCKSSETILPRAPYLLRAFVFLAAVKMEHALEHNADGWCLWR
jgi:hypothetical protein